MVPRLVGQVSPSSHDDMMSKLEAELELFRAPLMQRGSEEKEKESHRTGRTLPARAHWFTMHAGASSCAVCLTQIVQCFVALVCSLATP